MISREYTPAMGSAGLTPFYDLTIAWFTRERLWRDALLHEINPAPEDRILDVGCGTGSFLIKLAQFEPSATLTGIDPDRKILDIAQRKRKRADVDVEFVHGFLDEGLSGEANQFTKIVSSLVLHQTPLAEKIRILTNMRKLLEPGGGLYIADYGLQRSRLMRTLFYTTVQIFDGVIDTQPNADGCLPDLMRDAGFNAVTEIQTIPTFTGSISIYEGKATS